MEKRKEVWVLAVPLSPSDQGAAAGPSWSQLVPGPGPSLWLSDWDPGRLRPHVQTGVKIPVPPAPPGGREGLGTTAGLTAHPPSGPEPWEGQWAGRGWSQRLVLGRCGLASPHRAWPWLFGLALTMLVLFLKI